MGWIGLPEDVGPVDGELEAFGEGWRVVMAVQTPKMRDGARIFDGDLLSKESSPLGT